MLIDIKQEAIRYRARSTAMCNQSASKLATLAIRLAIAATCC